MQVRRSLFALALLASGCAVGPHFGRLNGPSDVSLNVSSDEVHFIRDARVTRTLAPDFTAGIAHAAAAVHVRSRDGHDYVVRYTWGAVDQFIPRVGSICTLSFRYVAPYGETDYNHPVMLGETLACDTGRLE